MDAACGDDDLLSRLERWAAAARTDEAGIRRERERWLRHQSREEGTLTGVLLDLAEWNALVAVHLAGDRVHHGRIVALGSDFVAVETGRRERVLVAIEAVRLVRSRSEVTVGDRSPAPVRLSLAACLAALSGERERLVLVTRDPGPVSVTGVPEAVGRDVVVVRTDGASAGTAYVPLAAVGEVLLA